MVDRTASIDADTRATDPTTRGVAKLIFLGRAVETKRLDPAVKDLNICG